MKRILSISLVLAAVSSLFPSAVPSFAAAQGDPPERALTSSSDPSEVLAAINRDMFDIYGLESYFPENTSKFGPYRKDLIRNKLQESQKIDGHYAFEVVYGSDHGDTLIHMNPPVKEYSGYTLAGSSVPTEGTPWYAGWSGHKIQDMKMIEEPWRKEKVTDRYFIVQNQFNKRGNGFTDRNVTLEDSIQEGLNRLYAGKKYSQFIYNRQNEAYKDRIVFDKGTKPSLGGKWQDYVHVFQPPTRISWGYGMIFIENTPGKITFLGIPMAPFDLVGPPEADLSASFEQLPSAAVSGSEVRIGVRVKSTFKNQVTAPFSWSVVETGTDRSVRGVAYSVKGEEGTAPTGRLTLNPNGESVLYATFTMPERDVRVQFNVNRDGDSPKEAYTANNSIDSLPRAVKKITPIEVGYDVLSRQLDFPLANGADITAVLRLPGGSSYAWTGNATGALSVSNQAPDLYRQFRDDNNPPVDEAGTVITRNPQIKAVVDRKDFGDDPVGGRFFQGAEPASADRIGSILYSGDVVRPWKYEYDYCAEADENGGCKRMETERRTGTASASFDDGTDTKAFLVHIYNGSKTLVQHKYDQKIEGNQDKTAEPKKLYWENEAYKFDVVRWMKDVDAAGKAIKWTAVDGRYERSFTQQASGELDWGVKTSMAGSYKTAREAAKNGAGSKSSYDKAVFATDRELQKFAYPIKSGYYFNPAGIYTFKVKTVTYKPTPDDTQDHKDLVEAATDSFRYGTDLMYIDSGKRAVNIRGEQLSASGGGFERKMGVLSAKNNKGVDGKELLTVSGRKESSDSYKKTVREIKSSAAREQDGDATDPYWKKVMEGYSESSTAGSQSSYQYREYVKNGKMYEITETTTVTIQINKGNLPLYTHANMANGGYTIRAWVEDIDLSKEKHAYNVLPALKGIKELDIVGITVQGSMLDDLNN